MHGIVEMKKGSNTDRNHWKEWRAEQRKRTTFCNEPWIRSRAVPPARFHFVLMPPCIFSLCTWAVIMLCWETFRKMQKKNKAEKISVSGFLNRWRCLLNSGCQPGDVLSIPFFLFVGLLCCLLSIAWSLQESTVHLCIQYCLSTTLIHDLNRPSFIVSASSWSPDSLLSWWWPDVDRVGTTIHRHLNMNRDVEIVFVP